MKKSIEIYAKDFLLIPNILSLIRILLIPAFIYLYLNEYKGAAILILIVSGFSDMADGLIARRFGMITELGKILDPIADKLNQAVIAVCLALKFPQVAPLFALFVIKELCMLCGGFVLLRSGQKPIAACWWGKLATVVFYTVMAMILVFGDYAVGIKLPDYMITVLVAVAALFMIFSFVNYIPVFIKIRSNKTADGKRNRDGKD